MKIMIGFYFEQYGNGYVRCNSVDGSNVIFPIHPDCNKPNPLTNILFEERINLTDTDVSCADVFCSAVSCAYVLQTELSPAFKMLLPYVINESFFYGLFQRIDFHNVVDLMIKISEQAFTAGSEQAINNLKRTFEKGLEQGKVQDANDIVFIKAMIGHLPSFPLPDASDFIKRNFFVNEEQL